MDVSLESLNDDALGGCLSSLSRDIYHHPGFLAFLSQATGLSCQLMVARKDGVIAAVLPFFEQTDDMGERVINSSPWFGSHGGCLIAGAGSAAGHEARTALLDTFRAYHERSGALSSTVILHPDEMPFLDDYRARLAPAAEDMRIRQVTPLPRNTEDLLAVFAGKTRNLVRKALSQGFDIGQAEPAQYDECWQALYHIHAENMGALGGQPKPEAHFTALRDKIPASSIRLSVARDETGNIVAALLLLVHGDVVEYLTPVVRVEARSRQPLSALIHEGMVWAIERGATSWNWGGTWKSQTSLHHFKAGFGAHDEEYAYLTVASASAVKHMAAARETLSRRFPFFFVYPYHAFGGSGLASIS